MTAPLPHQPTQRTQPATPTAPSQFISRLRASLTEGRFVKLQLGRPQGDATLDKLLVRRVVLRGVEHLSLVWRHRTKDITKNLPVEPALDLISSLLDGQFQHAHLVTQSHDIQLALGKKGSWGLRVGKLAALPHEPATDAPDLQGSTDAADNANPDANSATLPPATTGYGTAALPDQTPAQPTTQTATQTATQTSTQTSAQASAQAVTQATTNSSTQVAAHDRAKQRALSLATPFLAELGVTDAQHRLVPAMARKWRQINKFLEVLAHAIAQSPLAGRDPAQPVRVLDFGAGKGYLTFAVQHLLQTSRRVPDVVGVELRSELTTLCNSAVARLGLAGLRFEAGDVGQHSVAPTDIMIALHACDTATDVAMHHGLRSGAAVILCSPCCHKQLRPQMSAPPLLAPMLRHGIHMTEQAEMLTDTLRALLLQAEGYDTQVFEFISPEHTGKNKMVLAVRRATALPATQRAALQAQVAALKAHYGVTQQALETLLAGDSPSGQHGAIPVRNAPAHDATADRSPCR